MKGYIILHLNRESDVMLPAFQSLLTMFNSFAFQGLPIPDAAGGDPLGWFYANQIKCEEDFQAKKEQLRAEAKKRLDEIMDKKNQRMMWPSDSEFDDLSLSRCPTTFYQHARPLTSTLHEQTCIVMQTNYSVIRRVASMPAILKMVYRYIVKTELKLLDGM